MRILGAHICLLAICLISGSCLVAATDPTPGSELTWNQTVVEASMSAESRKAEAWFTFTNVSSVPVRVISVKSACDCLVPQLDRTVYYPGETGVLLAQVRVDGDQSEKRKRIRVTTVAGKAAESTTELVVIIPQAVPADNSGP